MAIEEKRLSGYRKVGKLYLIGSISSICPDLPIPIRQCPTCGGGVRQARGWTMINPHHLFGKRENGYKRGDIPCPICDPPDSPDHAILWVGGQFYPSPAEFLEEALRLGVSKTIPVIPRWFKIGKSVVYLAHPLAAHGNARKDDEIFDYDGKVPGIFAAFVPTAFQKLFWKSQDGSDEVKKCLKKNITPVFVPDGDTDYSPKAEKISREQSVPQPEDTEAPMFEQPKKKRSTISKIKDFFKRKE